MKTLLKYLFIGGFMLSGLSSCDGFLEEENKSDINSDEYFSESSGYESLVNACYSSLKSIWKGEPWLFCLGVDIYTRGESELVSGSYQSRDIYSSQLNEYSSLDAENGNVSSFYKNAYDAVQRCNTALAFADKVSGINETTLQQRQAEVRFLRAYYYYLLVEQFGDVALVTDEITSAATHFDRTPEQEVYKFIISELEAAVSVLPATQSDYGRITSGAVKHLLSLVHLTRGYKTYAESNDFSLAASLADEVINSGQYRLLSSFSEVFEPGNEKNDEIIFSVQYDASSFSSQYDGNGQSELFGWQTWEKINGGFTQGNTTYGWKKPQFTPTQFLYSLFDTDKDSRYDDTFKSEFYATDADEESGTKVGDLRVYFPKYDKPLSKADSVAFMEKNPHAIIVPREMWKQDIEAIGGSGIFPMVWKFYDPDASWPGHTTQYTGTRDIFLFRLADTYLMAAEAYLKLGNASKAAERVNAVRRRAAISGMESGMTVSAADVDIDFILDERARELTGEYKRWMDLKRTGKLIERTLKYNNLAARANAMDSHILVRPIPQTVIDQDSGDFPQNAGY